MAHIKPLSRKAYIYIIAFFAIMLAASLIMSCGNDSITNTGTNPPVNNDVLLLSIDSFNVSGTGFTEKDTLFTLIDSTHDSLKCTFTIHSNCELNDNALVNITPGNNPINLQYPDLNQSVTTYAAKNDTFWFGLYSKFNSTTTKYINITNIKLYLR